MTGTFTRRARTLIACTATLGVATVGLAAAPASAAADPSTTPFISEIHYDNLGTDVGEAVEVQAAAGTDLTGWSLVRYNGANGAPYTTPAVTQPLTGVVPAGDPSGDGVLVETYAVNGLQNGSPDGIALVDAAGTVVEFLSYEGTFTATGGPANGSTSVDIGVAQAGTEPVGSSLQKVDGTWTATETNTFGAVNGSAGGPGGGSEPFVSEIHYDNAGTDVGEAIEVQAGLGTDVTGWTVVLYNGNTPGAAVTYGTARDLGTTVTEPAGDPSGDGVVVLEYPSNGIQNGPNDGLALVDDEGTVVQFLSYEGVITASNGPAAGLTSTDIGVAQAGTEPVGASLQLVEGVWGSYDTNTFGEVNDTVGGGGGDPEPEPQPELCGLPTTSTIGAVQGSGPVSPVENQQVTLTGTVTSDTPGLSGFTIQDAGDGDAATSDGIFVWSPAEVSVGDVVTVRGTVDEFFTLTQVGSSDVGNAAVDVCSSGNAVPAPVVLPMPSTDAEREPFESMVVTITSELTVTGAFGLEQFGEVRVSTGGVLVNGTEIALPGAPANAVEAENRTREIVIDDGSSRSNLRPVPYLTLEQSLRIGDTVDELGTHVLSYGFSQWRLQPVTGAPDQVDFAQTSPRTPTAEDVGGDISVGAYNVLNYFVTLTSESSNARGATNPAAFQLQQAKIVQGIIGLGADVVGLQEIEYGVPFGKDADVAVAALTAALNAADAEGEWDYVPTPDYVRASPDVIQNAIVYRSDVVERVGESMTGGSFDTGAWSNAREPVAQTFAAADGDEITVVVNHFKSKGAGGASGANLDQGDGQGAFNADRTRQARALAAFAATLSAEDPDVFLVGDFNAYSQEDPIRVLAEAGYANVLTEADGYTYTFDQRNGSLDHILVNEAAVPKITGVDIWEVNAAEPFAYQYDSGIPELHATYAYRASDHNPSVVGFDTDAPLGTDVSLGSILLADTSGPELRDANGDDYDILLAQVLRVLEAKPDSPVGVLLDPTVALTAFLPNDDAFLATGLLPGRVTNEQAFNRRLSTAFTVDEIEQVLLGHVVVGQTLDSSVVVESDGASLTTAAGTTLTIDVRDDGTIAVVDDAEGNRDALLVLDAIDINLGQVQIGHTVDRVLLP